MANQTAILFTLLLILNFFVCSSLATPCSQLKTYPTIDKLKLAIQWGPGLCVRNPSCRSTYTETWGIHGLWPLKRVGTLENCCEETFNLALIQSFITDMRKYWPSFTSEDFRFWSHQWRKHGTCAYGNSQLRGQALFFRKAVDLAKNIDLKKILSDASIVPEAISGRSEYSLERIRSAIRSAIGKRVEFSCRYESAVSPKPILHEVYICYDPQTLNMVDCTDTDRCRGGRSALFLKKQ